jgi:hypothetical protein
LWRWQFPQVGWISSHYLPGRHVLAEDLGVDSIR